MNEDREKKSWREIDQNRDRSFHGSRSEAAEKKVTNVEKRGEALAKKALDDLFKPKKSKEQIEAWKKVRKAKSTQFPKAAEEFVELHGFPPEWDDLLRFLDHPGESFVLKTLDRLLGVLENQTPSAKELLVGKLRILKLTMEDEKLLVKIDSILEELAP